MGILRDHLEPAMSSISETIFASEAPSIGLLSSDFAHDEDRRISQRFRRRTAALLCSMGDALPLSCTTEDVSEGGLCACVPPADAPCVGQRFEVTIGDTSSRPQGGFFVDSCYATVVRTSRRTIDGSVMVLIGLRFDHPIYF
jgi:hypothetical protein